MAELGSAVDAVSCAVEIQRRMARRNTDVQQDRKIELRIGIDVGDIIVDEDGVYGDGVNTAARLEEIADPGGVLNSDAVHHQVEGRVVAHRRQCVASIGPTTRQ